MKLKKRKKSSRFRGSHTHGRGFKKKARGSGHQGGVGMAGTGKRADQKKTLIINLYGNNYFGKDKVLRGRTIHKFKVVNIQQILDNLHSFIKLNKGYENKDFIEIDLSDYKILANTKSKINKKLKIKALAASNSAIEKIRQAGGEIIIEKNKL